jgi:hypothetical protein
VNLTVGGTNLTGATSLVFINAANLLGDGHGQGKGHDDSGSSDTAFTVTNVQVNAAETQLTATVAIAATAQLGPRLVRVLTPNGESTQVLAMVNTFTVVP